MRTTPLALGITAVSFLLLACADVQGPGAERQEPGIIAFYGEDVVISAPDTVARGQAFPVTVRTYGGGCTSKGPTHLETAGLHATVLPFDIDSGAHICTSILNVFLHTADVRFDLAGTATVVFRGRRLPEGEAVMFERSIVVR